MPGTRKLYLLTATAEQDFREARRWSMLRWGRELTQQYFTELHECAEDLARNPQQFASTVNLSSPAELKIHPVKEHYLVYLPVSKTTIVIIALIRQTRDVPAILRTNGFKIKRQLKEISEKLAQGVQFK